VGLALVGALGCSNTALERQRPDRPPETRVTSGPPDSTSAWSYRVHFQWMGTDPDDAVDHFEFILVDHAAAEDSIQAGAGHRVVITVPTADDPRWRRTTRFDSTFIVRADTLRLDPRSADPDSVRRHFSERWHTFFVRAVDSRGLPDPTPDYRSFNARTLAPFVALAAPVHPGREFTTAQYSTIRWDGTDPIDELHSQSPDSSRWVLVPTSLEWYRVPRFAGFPDSLYSLPSRFHWSHWRGWNASDGSGTEARVESLRTREGRYIGYYMLAVQAKDEAGAVSPVFDWSTPDRNNVALMIVSGTLAPLLAVWEPSLGAFTFLGATRPGLVIATPEQALRFRWSADASSYGARIAAYRYGWDILDRSDRSQWEQDWSPDAHHSTPRQFASGIHRFYLEARDDAGLTTSAKLDVEVHAMTLSRDLLFVDDTSRFSPRDEAREDARWMAVLDSVADRHAFHFAAARDVYDVFLDHHAEPPPIGLVLDYKAIVWTVFAGRGSALRQLAYFVDPFVYSNSNTVFTFDYLNTYLDNGGQMWVSGFRPANLVWPVDQLWIPADRKFPVNVTNWDDPINSHAQYDSVGTISWLYRMGVEAFDVGSGGASIARPTTDHNCRGFRTEVPGVPPLEVDASSWDQPAGQGRPNIEIFNMPPFMAAQRPPLLGTRSLALYTYVSGRPEDSANGFAYPQTADHQPAFVLGKRSPQDTHYSRALCGFEPYLLTFDSHLRLAEYVLVHEMGLGQPQQPPP
jgi:hypothetical protein